MKHIGNEAIDQLFREARTANSFLDRAVPAEVLTSVYELARLGPTSMNSQPGRFVFLASREARERLMPAMNAGNQAKTAAAPVTVIVASDSLFYEFMPTIWHRPGARENFESNPGMAAWTAFRNSSLAGAYFIIAARAHGLACGPMSGFDTSKVNAEFFSDGRLQANFLINLGYPDPQAQPQPERNRRLGFEEACQVL